MGKLRLVPTKELIADAFIEKAKAKKTLFNYVGRRFPSTASKAMCEVMNEAYPPKKGWRRRWLRSEIDDERYEKLKNAVGDRKKERKSAGTVKTKYKKLSNKFFISRAWRDIRYKALLLYGRKCLCCGATPESGIVLHVDHVKPRSLYPELELDIGNLQILCEDCNLGKSNIDETDFR